MESESRKETKKGPEDCPSTWTKPERAENLTTNLHLVDVIIKGHAIIKLSGVEFTRTFMIITIF